jgi:type II restriction enzyme
VREDGAAHQRQQTHRDGDRTHTEIQGWLRELGRALGFDVWIAANDGARDYAGGRLADGCVESLPASVVAAPGYESVRLIDVLWLERDQIAAAFEVEHTTSIYSGICRLLDLAIGAPGQATEGLYLVAPDEREKDVRAQLMRPAFRPVAHLGVRYLPYGELDRHRDAMARFGSGLKAIRAIAKAIP